MINLVQNSNLKNKKVLLLVDYNVPVENKIRVSNSTSSTRANLILSTDSNYNSILGSTFKIDQTLKTIKFIKEQEPTVLFILTHLGRPKGREECKVTPIFEYLKSVFNCDYVEIRSFPNSANSISMEANSSIFFGDNSRYYSESELNEFYRQFDVIVNDAFGCAHRPLCIKTVAGFLIQKEIKKLENIKNCDLLILGGAKGNEKMKIVKKIEGPCYLAGLLAVEIMRELGHEMGIPFGSQNKQQKVIEKEDDFNFKIGIDTVRDNLNENQTRLESSSQVDSAVVYLPVDFLVLTGDGQYKIKNFNEILKNDSVLDIGEKTVGEIEKFVKKIGKKTDGKSKKIFWNGPVGKFEDEKAISTKKVVEILANFEGKTIVGGGETLTAVLKYSSLEKFDHVSTGGGAMLSFLSGEHMPGIESLKIESKKDFKN
jgi:phosphoglycerate kinase